VEVSATFVVDVNDNSGIHVHGTVNDQVNINVFVFDHVYVRASALGWFDQPDQDLEFHPLELTNPYVAATPR